MTSSGCTYRFIESSLSDLSLNYDLEIRQQPERAKLSTINERDRRSIEPPPILQLHWQNCSNEELKKCLQSPFYFTVANLVTEEDPETPLLPAENYLSGTIVSSLHRLRDIDNSDGGFFVFGDLAVRKEGKFKLRFSLFEIQDGQVVNRNTILSNTFTVFIPKQYPGPVEATFLSRTFSDQGVKMRIRKEHRLQTRKRKLTTDTINDNPTKRYYTEKPSYAEPSSTSSDVFFGRWQTNAPPIKHEPVHRISTPPYQPYEGLPNKLKYSHTEYHAQAFPSPESTTISSITRSVLCGQTNPHTQHLASPALIPSTNFTDSPLLTQLPLASDHRLPTPSNSMEDLHEIATGSQSWGTRLPPLRAIMSDIQQYNKHFPLLLPPPIVSQPCMTMHQYRYH